MRKPIESVVENFGFKKNWNVICCRGDISHNTDSHWANLPCFAEFTYNKLNVTGTGENAMNAFDKVVNVKLPEGLGIEIFDFENAPLFTQVLCLCCGYMVGTIVSSDVFGNVIKFGSLNIVSRKARAHDFDLQHVSRIDRRYYRLCNLAKALFSNRQIIDFPPGYVTPDFDTDAIYNTSDSD